VAKVRVHELAKKYDVPSKDVLSMLSDLGEFVKAPSSTVEPPVVKRFEDKYGADLSAKAEAKAAKQGEKMKEMPKTGGIPINASVLGLGAGVLLVGGGLLVRKVTR
jgi:translation initiation factor IF-2